MALTRPVSLDLTATDEALDAPMEDVHSTSWQDGDEGASESHHLVPARLVRVAQQLREIDESDDSTAISMLSRMKLPQMTGQIRDVEQRALEIAREEGREEFRVKALMHNLVHHTLPTVIATAKAEPANSGGAASGPPPPPLGPSASVVAGLKFAYPPSVGRNAHAASANAVRL